MTIHNEEVTRFSLAIERLNKFAVEWSLLVARGGRDDFIYELHPGDPRHAVCRASDIYELLASAAGPGTAETPSSAAQGEAGQSGGNEDCRDAQTQGPNHDR